ncbi:uncharacterized protein (TIGR02217 family) [Oxalobacteraceae bacterium GrIS 1.11]
MSDILFPTLPGLTWDVIWQPQFHTKVQSAVSGKEYRASLMANPLYKLTLNFEFLRHGPRPELRQLLGFFLARRGSFDNFLYRFEDDCSVSNQPIGVADGRTKSFQLMRGFGADFIEPVQNIDTVLDVKIDGLANVDYTRSATGMLTFAAAPAAGAITWSGAYFYRARFVDDEQDFEKFMKNLWKAKSVKLLASLGTRI